MTRAAAFALCVFFLSPLTFAQDAALDSEAASDSGGADSGGGDSGGDSAGDDSAGDDGTDDGTEDDATDAEATFGAADLAGETGGCQGCSSGQGFSLSAAAFGLLLVGLSRRR